MSTPAPISRFRVPDVTELPADIREQILAVQEKTGFIPNVFLALAHRPEAWRGFFSLHDAVMKHDSSLTKAEREMIVVTVSGGNECHYCVIAHGAILRVLTKHSRLADQLAINYRKAEITPRQRAMLDFAVKVSQHAQAIEDADYARLREHGFDLEDIWDIGAISAFFCLSNRLANLIDIRPNDEFYSMGRTF